jgi:hypothetical protein
MSFWSDVTDTVGDVLGGAGDLVGGAINTVGKIGQTVLDHPLEAAALAAAGYTFAPEVGAWFGSDGTALMGSESGVAAGTVPTAASELSGLDLGGPGGSPASWLNGGGGAAAAGGAGALSKYLTPAAIFGSSLIGANAAKSAAATGAQASAEANRVLYQMYQEQKGLQEPYRAAGVTAQNKLMDLLGLSPNTTAADYGKYGKDFSASDFTADPGYAFRLSEGQKALDNQAAARGGLISGNALRAATAYGQNMGSQEYQNAYNRYQTNRANQLAPLGSLITSGQNAAANTGAAAGNYGANYGNNVTTGAAAKAAGDVGSTNSLTGGLNTYLNYSSNQDLVNALARSKSIYGG